MTIPATEARPQSRTIATCRYQSFNPEMGTPVNITLRPPRWKLPYEVNARIRELAPTATEFKLDGLEFDAEYRRRLEAMGIDEVLQLITTAVPRGRAVLLCYEDVWQRTTAVGEVCHRRTLATWIREQTGEDIPELSPRSPGTRPPSEETRADTPAVQAGPASRQQPVRVDALVLHRDDAAYRVWMEGNPDGRTLNRQADGGVRMHRPNCDHFWTDATHFEPTLRPKVCVPDERSAESLATLWKWQPLTRCQTCWPPSKVAR